MTPTKPSNRPHLRWSGVCIDCLDAEELAQFYGTIFGWATIARDSSTDRTGGSGWILMSGPDGGPTVSFQAEEWYQRPTWPEVDHLPTKMMHFEVSVASLDEAVSEVTRAGGRVAPHQPPDRDHQRLRVMLDPAGHPFCLCEE
jgi:catechol 2,3-dioxygenase-like lactoylglutathione lyase family enzyme